MKEKRWANEERIEEIGLRVSAKFVAIISTEILCTSARNEYARTYWGIFSARLDTYNEFQKMKPTRTVIRSALLRSVGSKRPQIPLRRFVEDQRTIRVCKKSVHNDSRKYVSN